MQFALHQARAKITSVNVRAEIHGDSRVPTCDIKIAVKMSNAALDHFATGLKEAIFCGGQPKQGELLGGVSNLTSLRFPHLGALIWDWKGAGYDFTVHYGVDGSHDIALKADIDAFRFTCEEGGTVEIVFRAQAHPTEAQLGRLCTLIQCEVDVTLVPPKDGEEQKSGELLDGENGEEPSKPESAPKSGRTRGGAASRPGRSEARAEAEKAFE